jgi:hypothetical protein
MLVAVIIAIVFLVIFFAEKLAAAGVVFDRRLQ